MITLVKIIVGGALALLLLGREVIDSLGTLDFVEQRYPRLIRWSHRRGWQRVILLTVLLMFAAILHDSLQEPDPPTYVFDKGAYPTLEYSKLLQAQERVRELESEKGHTIVVQRNVPADGVRTQTDMEQQTFIQTLLTATASPVSIIGVGSVPEPHTVAQQLADSFKAAGWFVSRSEIGSMTSIVVGVGATNNTTAFSPHGICVEAASLDDVSLKTVRQAFVNVKRSVAVLKSSCPVCACPGPTRELKPHEVRIVVGPK